MMQLGFVVDLQSVVVPSSIDDSLARHSKPPDCFLKQWRIFTVHTEPDFYDPDDFHRYS
jgi:hypothetical protein